MKTMFRILIIALILSSCKKEQNKMSFALDNKVEISVKDKVGNDLLNPSKQGALLNQNIKIYYLLDGYKKRNKPGKLRFAKKFHDI